jgi:hypothetical protein
MRDRCFRQDSKNAAASRRLLTANSDSDPFFISDCDLIPPFAICIRCTFVYIETFQMKDEAYKNP